MSESESDQRHDLGLTIAQDVYLFVHCIDASLVSLSMYIMGVGLCTIGHDFMQYVYWGTHYFPCVCVSSRVFLSVHLVCIFRRIYSMFFMCTFARWGILVINVATCDYYLVCQVDCMLRA